ncbi:hypothetical protein CHS0354_001672 [Potamilus streckersoni]|uniref:Uncharacterized protein n=1 Tax=Potamilus streckersoni TaxID=2493646 RepID=A0AAE0RUU4_9BIVA|nr:hypothetical protein CHS0354_001672 [Potamilus streckersoni]
MAANSSFDNISCSICLEQFKDPKFLSCFHTFCYICLEDIVQRNEIKGSFECPLCRACISIPANGVAGFQSNFYVPTIGSNFEALCKGSSGVHPTKLPEVSKICRISVTCCPNGAHPIPCIALLFYTAPDKCPKPRISKKLPGPSIELSWSPPTRYERQPEPSFTVLLEIPGHKSQQVHKGKETSCTVNDIILGKKHFFRIQARNPAGDGPWSDKLEFTPNSSPPDEPSSLNISDIGKASITLTWKEPATHWSDITGYIVEMASDDHMKSIRFQANAIKNTITNLHPGQFYNIRVQADSKAGPGPFSQHVSCITLPDRPDKVVYIETKPTQTFVDLKWKAPSNNGREITNYIITLNDEQMFQTSSGLTEYRVENLIPKTKYTVSITAQNSLGTSDQGTVLKFTTLSALPPLSLKCKETKHNSLTLEWGGGEGPPYTLEMIDPFERDGNYSIRYKGMGTKCTVKRLKPNTSYTFKATTILTTSVKTFKTSIFCGDKTLTSETNEFITSEILDTDSMVRNRQATKNERTTERTALQDKCTSVSSVHTMTKPAVNNWQSLEAETDLEPEAYRFATQIKYTGKYRDMKTSRCRHEAAMIENDLLSQAHHQVPIMPAPTVDSRHCWQDTNYQSPGHPGTEEDNYICYMRILPFYAGPETGFQPCIADGVIAVKRVKWKSFFTFCRYKQSLCVYKIVQCLENESHIMKIHHKCQNRTRSICMDHFRQLFAIYEEEVEQVQRDENISHIMIMQRVALREENYLHRPNKNVSGGDRLGMNTKLSDQRHFPAVLWAMNFKEVLRSFTMQKVSLPLYTS